MLLVIPFVSVIILLIIVGVALWLINTYIPMQPPIKTIINVLVIIAVLLYIFRIFDII